MYSCGLTTHGPLEYSVLPCRVATEVLTGDSHGSRVTFRTLSPVHQETPLIIHVSPSGEPKELDACSESYRSTYKPSVQDFREEVSH